MPEYIEYKISDVDKAIEHAWNEDKAVLLYPKDMNKIAVDIHREEFCHLKYTYIVESDYFKDIEDFIKEVKHIHMHMYGAIIAVPEAITSLSKEEYNKYFEEEYENAKEYLKDPDKHSNMLEDCYE